MKKLLIFDLDGTLLNTIPDIAQSINHVRTLKNLPPKGTDEVQASIGHGLTNLLRESFADLRDLEEALPQLRNVYSSHYAAHCADKTRAFEGIANALQALLKMGATLAVNTNKPHEFVEPVLHACLAGIPFAAVVGAGAYEPKPDPAGVFEILRQTGFSASDCAYIGDLPVDVQTAKNAGAVCVGVAWGYGGEEALLDADADQIARHPSDLPDVIALL